MCTYLDNLFHIPFSLTSGLRRGSVTSRWSCQICSLFTCLTEFQTTISHIVHIHVYGLIWRSWSDILSKFARCTYFPHYFPLSVHFLSTLWEYYLKITVHFACPVQTVKCCCFTSTVNSCVMSGRSFNLTALFLGRLIPSKRLTKT